MRKSTKCRSRATRRAAAISTARASCGRRSPSGHLGAFDRSKCKGPLNGPTATGKHCPEGWTLYPLPGPQLGGVTDNGSGETPYYAWVDQHDTLGLGKDVPIATGNQNNSLIALKDGKLINMVVPYPMGFWAKGLDGRIDDPNAGWKGRGVWSNTGNRTPFHIEGGKENSPKVVHFQMRPRSAGECPELPDPAAPG